MKALSVNMARRCGHMWWAQGPGQVGFSNWGNTVTSICSTCQFVQIYPRVSRAWSKESPQEAQIVRIVLDQIVITLTQVIPLGPLENSKTMVYRQAHSCSNWTLLSFYILLWVFYYSWEMIVRLSLSMIDRLKLWINLCFMSTIQKTIIPLIEWCKTWIKM